MTELDALIDYKKSWLRSMRQLLDHATSKSTIRVATKWIAMMEDDIEAIDSRQRKKPK